MKKTLEILVLCSLRGWAQDPISLKDAVRLALDKNKAVEASFAAAKGCGKPNRGGPERQPAQGQLFGVLDPQRQPGLCILFLADAAPVRGAELPGWTLNRPDFLNNFQSQVTADQSLYDAGQTKHAVRSAELTKEMTTEEGRRTQMEVIASVIRSYYDVLLSAEQFNVTSQAMRSAQADLERAQAVRSAGMSTDVDVLSIRVHLASVREQQIRRAADLDVARAALNDALGLPLDAAHTLTTALAPLKLPESPWQTTKKTPSARGRRLAS